MIISKIREEEWGIGIRYETVEGFKEFVFEKDMILNEMKISNIEQLQLKKNDLESGTLVDLLIKNIHKGFAEGKKQVSPSPFINKLNLQK